MTPEKPFDNDLTFDINGGKKIIDGKSYCPVLLRITLDRQAMWRLSHDILSGLQNNTDPCTFYFSGDFRDTVNTSTPKPEDKT